MRASWQLFIDTGGTFTDALAIAPDGGWSRAKVLSSGALRGIVSERVGPGVLKIATAWQARADVLRQGTFRVLGDDTSVPVAVFDPEKSLLTLADDPGPAAIPGAAFEVVTGEEAPLLAARLLTGTAAGDPLPDLDLRLGTTLATNALLTRAGAPTALFITEGFADLLAIGTQQRPDLFALEIRKPQPLYDTVVEVPERLGADGAVVRELDEAELVRRLAAVRDRGITCAAVALMHADRHPDHEHRVAELLAEAGFEHVCCSRDQAEAIRILPRTETAVVDACLTPVVAGYLGRIQASIGSRRLLAMTSAGGLAGAAAVRPKELLLSGPAGGVVGAARAGRRAGFGQVIGFDMGGTSTDVARYDGQFEYVFEHRVGDAQLLAPALAIETVAAGGGSICRYGENGLAVGPQSAGADPGPACYGAGGPLTVTDVNLLLGRLDPERFGIPVDPAPARAELDAVCNELLRRTGEEARPEAVLEGFLAIANERMAEAIRRISIRRGYDPAGYALVAFGGAGGQHACAVAQRLGAAAVVVPPDAGLLSAWGMAGAVIERFADTQLLQPVAELEDRVPELLGDLADRSLQALAEEGVAAGDAVIARRIAEMRFFGQETPLQVEVAENQPLGDAFRASYREQFGHDLEGRAIELVSLRVVASSRPDAAEPAAVPPASSRPDPVRTQQAWFGALREVPVHQRDDLIPGAVIDGPALVLERHATTVLEPGWTLQVDGGGALVIRTAKTGDHVDAADRETRPEAVQVELFSARFEAVARQMGEALQRTAVSTNVKERLDFSCALLDAGGGLVVNAPHIPVHLGSLGLCVRGVRAALDLRPGDVAATNHPAFGGSHLPDLTVIAPVHEADGTLLAHVAARAHHAEIGGLRPGSMPPDAVNLAQEGVVIPPTLVVKQGELREEAVIRLLEDGPHPSRAVPDNIADLTAAVAACHRGAEAFTALVTEHGTSTVQHYLGALQDKASRRLREALAALPDGESIGRQELDDGSVLAVRVTVAGERATVDFGGSAPVHPGNLNASPAIVHSVLIYVLRLLVAEEMPLNEGLLEPVEVILPEGMLAPDFGDDPTRAPAVVGGNVETSQRLVDTLVEAFGLCAAGQGTMNNVVFGDDTTSYYETVCGGAGAGRGFAGASGVHTHMTNTRITDPEVLELRYPVRLERFALRPGSGGSGRWPGGDGVVRHLTFLAPLDLSLLTQRRRSGPFGLAGGNDGLPGLQRIVRANGRVETLAGIASCAVAPGDRLELETPGGGGFEPTEERT